MSLLCPKCESEKLNKAGICPKCGYVLKTRCGRCGHTNIVSARFCGVCGRGMTFSIRAKSFINKRIGFIQKMQLRRFAFGLVFGALLVLFAFGSMGMKSAEYCIGLNTAADSLKQNNPNNINAPQKAALARPLPSLFTKTISDYFENENLSKSVKLADLKFCVEAIKSSLSTVQSGQCTASEYMVNISNFADKNAITRANTAMVVFYLLSDTLNLRYKDFSQECQYTDIPKFHFLTVPANALKKYNITLAQSERRFGINDVLTLKELKQTTTDIMRSICSQNL